MIKQKSDDNALRDYKLVKYFPFGNEAGSPYILTSDPLGYLEAWIDSQLNSIMRDSGKKRTLLKKAKYFTLLSKDFFNSSKYASMPSKGTLIYYSLINLVKVYLSTLGYELESKIEHHGLSLPPNSKIKLKLANSGGESISIFHEFAKCLDKPIINSDGNELDFVEIIRNLPEVHEIGYALDLFPRTKRKFLPIEINIRTNSTRKKIYYTISYDKKFDKQVKIDKLDKGIFKENLQIEQDIDERNKSIYKSKIALNYTYSSSKSWKICYPKLINNINSLNINLMLTRQGYRYYLDLEPYRLHRLSSVLAFTFYIGTVARYRPSLNEEILKGKYQSIINEALISCPNQFFYLLVSYITNQICAIPMAKIE